MSGYPLLNMDGVILMVSKICVMTIFDIDIQKKWEHDMEHCTILYNVCICMYTNINICYSKFDLNEKLL